MDGGVLPLPIFSRSRVGLLRVCPAAIEHLGIERKEFKADKYIACGQRQDRARVSTPRRPPPASQGLGYAKCC